MGRNTNRKPDHLCFAIFAVCLGARLAEYFLVETDKTAIGENALHKIVGIILLAVILKRLELTWSDIGFQRKDFVNGILTGLFLGGICFAVSYGVEFAVLALQGDRAHLELYISSFSLTGSQAKHTDLLFFALCIFFNIINVWMEEGVFRGLLIKTLAETRSFLRANLIASFSFGVWHIVMPLRSYASGEMSLAATVLMCIGYIALSGVMGIKWGLLFHMTGNIWVGLGDHLFNNTIATNMLHVVSPTGADELQMIRVIAAQLLSFVLVVHYYKKQVSYEH